MKIRCVWEHNGNDSIVYSDNFAGAYTRGRTKEEAIRKMPLEITAYSRWAGKPSIDLAEPEIVQEKASELTISDADSVVIILVKSVLTQTMREALRNAESGDLPGEGQV